MLGHFGRNVGGIVLFGPELHHEKNVQYVVTKQLTNKKESNACNARGGNNKKDVLLTHHYHTVKDFSSIDTTTLLLGVEI
jgi:hypothetical protein